MLTAPTETKKRKRSKNSPEKIFLQPRQPLIR